MRCMTRFTILAALVITAATPSVHAQDSTVLVIDHAAGVFIGAYRTHGGERETLPARMIGGTGSPSITVRTADPVRVVLRNFNTALQDVRVTTKTFESPDYALYRGLLDELTPYAAEVPLLLGIRPAEREGPPDQAVMKLTAFRDSITDLRAKAIWRIRALSLLDQVPATEVAATRQFAAWYLGGSAGQQRLRFLDSLAVWYDALGLMPASKEVNDLREQSKTLITRAMQLEQVILRLSTISNTTEVDLDAHTTWKSGITATVTVTASELVPYAGLTPSSVLYTVTLVPDPLVRPMSALAVIYWGGKEFETHTTERQSGSHVVTSTADDIPHWSQGLSFGLSWRFLDFRDVDDAGMALSIPELIVNPFDAFRAIGLGVGASYGFAKLSAGVLWIRNTVLDGQSAGQILADPAALRTRAAYTPRLFVSVGVCNISF